MPLFPEVGNHLGLKRVRGADLRKRVYDDEPPLHPVPATEVGVDLLCGCFFTGCDDV